LLRDYDDMGMPKLNQSDGFGGYKDNAWALTLVNRFFFFKSNIKEIYFNDLYAQFSLSFFWIKKQKKSLCFRKLNRLDLYQCRSIFSLKTNSFNKFFSITFWFVKILRYILFSYFISYLFDIESCFIKYNQFFFTIIING
jgi:hypothetical protein